jgi:hypothetical protein
MAEDKKDLTAGFAFVNADKVPKRETSDRLAEFRAQQAEERLVAGRKVSKGLVSGKALTDNVVYMATPEVKDDKGVVTEDASTAYLNANRVASRAKALVTPALKEVNMKPAVQVTGTEAEGFRWFIMAKAITAEE